MPVSIAYSSQTSDLGYNTYLYDVCISEDGTKLFTSVDSYHIYQYELSTPGDPATASFVNNYALAGGDQAYGMWLAPDASAMFLFGKTNYAYGVTKYVMSTPGDVTTMSRAAELNLSTGGFWNLKAGGFTAGGSKMFVVDQDGLIRRYTLSTPYDITTAAADQSYNVLAASTGESSVKVLGIAVRDDVIVILNRYMLARLVRYSMADSDLTSIAFEAIDYVNANDGVYYNENGFCFNSTWDAIFSTAVYESGTGSEEVVIRYDVSGLELSTPTVPLSGNDILISAPKATLDVSISFGARVSLTAPKAELTASITPGVMFGIGITSPKAVLSADILADHLFFIGIPAPKAQVYATISPVPALQVSIDAPKATLEMLMESNHYSKIEVTVPKAILGLAFLSGCTADNILHYTR